MRKFFLSCLPDENFFSPHGQTESNLLFWPYLASVAKFATKKIEVLILSMKFPSLEVVLYLLKCTICLCMKYCYHVQASAPCCNLDMYGKLQKQLCGTVGLLLYLLNPWINIEMQPVCLFYVLRSSELAFFCNSRLFSLPWGESQIKKSQSLLKTLDILCGKAGVATAY